MQWPKPCKIDQMKMFGHLFNQTIVHMTWCGGAMFYYRTHTWTNDESTHGPRDPKSLIRMSWYAPWISQSLKYHIGTQLGLGHTTKQIYDKHKTIWWECVNVEKSWLCMTSFDNKTLHIWIGNIRKVLDGCTKTLSFQFDLGFCIIRNMFYFQEANEVNGIQISSTLGI